MNLGILAAIAYGILVLVGGILGYIQAKSKMSLISGLVSGVLLILAAIASLAGQPWGLFLAAAITAALIVVFIIRWFKTRKFMPAGLMIVIGIPALLAIATQLI